MQTEDHKTEQVADEPTLETLERSECFALMATVPIGRVIYAVRNTPGVRPVNFTLDGQDVLISTGRGAAWAAVLRGTTVVFEVDQYDPQTQTGWDVVITGEADWMHHTAELARLGELPPQPWAPGPRENVLRIVPRRVEGRRIVRSRPSPDQP